MCAASAMYDVECNVVSEPSAAKQRLVDWLLPLGTAVAVVRDKRRRQYVVFCRPSDGRTCSAYTQEQAESAIGALCSPWRAE